MLSKCSFLALKKDNAECVIIKVTPIKSSATKVVLATAWNKLQRNFKELWIFILPNGSIYLTLLLYIRFLDDFILYMSHIIILKADTDLQLVVSQFHGSGFNYDNFHVILVIVFIPILCIIYTNDLFEKYYAFYK